MGSVEWTISRYDYNGTASFINRIDGYNWTNEDQSVTNPVYSNTVTIPLSIRPTFYLKSDVKIQSGEGTKENPYRIA